MSLAPAGSNWRALQKSLAHEHGHEHGHGPGHRQLRKKKSQNLHSIARQEGQASGHTAVASASETMPPPTDAPRPWFADDLAPEDLALAMGQAPAVERAVQWEGVVDAATKKRLVLGEVYNPNAAKREVGTYIAVDCEMVGVGPRGTGSMLARVSIVNWHGHVVLDTFVRPRERVTDFRTWVSGVRASDVKNAPTFAEVQAQVADLFKGRVLVGHAIENDLKALLLSHPRPRIRDTASFKPLQELTGNKQPGLRTLARTVLGIEIQSKKQAHSSVEDAQATMAVFRTQKDRWDEMLGRAKRPRAERAEQAERAERAEQADAAVPDADAHADAPVGTSVPGRRLPRKKSTASIRRPASAAGWWEE